MDGQIIEGQQDNNGDKSKMTCTNIKYKYIYERNNYKKYVLLFTNILGSLLNTEVKHDTTWLGFTLILDSKQNRMNGYFTEAGMEDRSGMNRGGTGHVKANPTWQANNNNDQPIDSVNLGKGPAHKPGPRSTSEGKRPSEKGPTYKSGPRSISEGRQTLGGSGEANFNGLANTYSSIGKNREDINGKNPCNINHTDSRCIFPMLFKGCYTFSMYFLTDDSSKNNTTSTKSNTGMESANDSINYSNTSSDASSAGRNPGSSGLQTNLSSSSDTDSSTNSSFYSADSGDGSEIYAVSLGWRKPLPFHPPGWLSLIHI